MRSQILLGALSALAAQSTAVPWTQADLTAATELGDAAKCYYGLFSNGPCGEGTKGGVYLIDSAWYTGHSGGTFSTKTSPKGCGTVIDDWKGKSGSHPASQLGDGTDLTLGGIKATYVEAWDCSAPTTDAPPATAASVTDAPGPTPPPPSTDTVWTQADLTAATALGDATKCYFAIFSKGACDADTTGGVYLIDSAWYTGHFGGTFASQTSNGCGSVIENWGSIDGSHPVANLANNDKLEYGGGTKATYEAPWDCAVPTVPTTKAPPVVAGFDFDAECAKADNYVNEGVATVQYCVSYDAAATEYTNYMRVPAGSAWGAIGINSVFKMPDTEMTALSFKDGKPLLEYRKTSGYSGSSALTDVPQNIEVGYDAATGIVAKWTRPVKQAGLIDLTDGTANLFIIAIHQTGTYGAFSGKHSKTPISFADFDLQAKGSAGAAVEALKGNSKNLAHGALMIFAWACLSPIGSMFMRYGKHLPLSFWFKTHIYIQPLAIVFTIIAFILIIASGVTLETIDEKSKGHAYGGLAVLVLCIVQGLLGGLREKISDHQKADDDTDFNHGHRRWLFNLLHKSNGWILFGLSLSTIYKGLTLFPDSSTWIQDPAPTLFMAYCLVAAGIIFILEIIHTAQGKYDFGSGGPFNCSGSKSVGASFKADGDFEMKVRSIALALFTALSMAVTVGLWVIIAETEVDTA